MKKQIIHLSDIHVGKKDKVYKPRWDKIVRFIRYYYPEVPVCITGDITDDGKEEQFIEARKWLDELAESNPVFVVPGNHDYAFKGFLPFHSAGTNFKKWYEHLGRPLGVGDRAPLPNFWMPVDNFEGYGRFQLDDYTQLFYVDSGDPERKASCARGWISDDMINILGKELQKYSSWTRVVMLHHHPFNKAAFTALEGAKKLMKALNIAGCELLMFGHKHTVGSWRNTYPPIPGRFHNPGKQIKCISASHASTKPISGQFGAITVIDIDNVGTKDVYFRPCLKLVDFVT
jgi:3',5'-cyclic AMP phosphodiesterase CpdA